ncbi:MAG TPA: hypothetical protein DF774_01425 [Rheinheimera sp.]|nr:hypothetical protein [Rheinheimera sp.]
MWNSKLFRQSILCGSLAFSAGALSESNIATHVPVKIQFKDGTGSGVNDTTPLTLPDGSNTTVGAFRKKTIEYVTRAVSLQFKNNVQLRWDVEFKTNAGYDALTLGPAFTRVTTSNQDVAGIAALGKEYPTTLLSALNGRDVGFPDMSHATTQFLSNPNNIQHQIAPSSGQSVLTSVVYHELIHVYGFADRACLGSCIPNRSAEPSHISQLFWYRDPNGNLVRYDALDLDGREAAGKSTNRFLAGGTVSAPRTSAAVREELTAGTYSDNSGNYVQMFATPTDKNDWDGQVGSHISFDVQPVQLMYSSAANVQDLGIAAAMLCDAGWCRKTGQVIDIRATAKLNSNASTSTTSYIDVKFENLVNSDVDKLKAQVRLDAQYAGVTISGDQQGCTLEGTTLNCAFDLPAMTSKTLTLTTGALSSAGYVVAGEVYSDDFDVDRNGFNNILDATIKTVPVSNPGTGGGTGGGTGNGGTGNNPPSSESSGGSMSLWSIGLLGLAGWRRLAAVKRVAAPVAAAFLLSACGGGGGGDTATTPPVVTKPDLRVILATSSTVPESSTIDVPVTITGAQGAVTATVNHSGPSNFTVTPTISSTGGSLRLQLGDLFSHQQANVQLVVSDADGRSSTVSMAVALQNSAGFHRVVANIPETGVELKESSSMTVQFTFDGATGDVKAVVEPTTSEQSIVTKATLTNAGGTLEVTAGELVRANHELKLAITFTDTAGQVQKTNHSFSLVNSSGAKLLDEFSQTYAAAPAFAELKPERDLVRKLSVLAVMTNSAYTGTETTLFDRFQQEVSSKGKQGAITSWLQAHAGDAARYQSGAAEEGALKTATAELMALLQAHSSAVDTVINDAVSANDGTVPPIALGTILLDSTSKKLSRFIGNKSLGQYQDNRWQFSANYVFLTPIVYPETQTCKAE